MARKRTPPPPLTRALPGSQETNPYQGLNWPWSWRPWWRADGSWDPDYQADRGVEDPGWRAVRWIESYCRHTKGRWRGDKFILAPFQLHRFLTVFGTLDEFGLRVIRTDYEEFGRKNGKSEDSAATSLYLLAGDGEESPEVYGAACDRDQAGIIYGVAADMVRLDPDLRERLKTRDSVKRIVYPQRSGFYRAIPADAAGAHGFNASGTVLDEVRTQKTRKLWSVLTTSGDTRAQPLNSARTTAAVEGESALYDELHERAVLIRDGVIDDPSWYVDVRNMPLDVDWRDEKNWYFPNPGLGTRKDVLDKKAFKDITGMRLLAKQAEVSPEAEATFRNMHGNQQRPSIVRAIRLEVWDACHTSDTAFLEAELKGRKCYGGLNVASTADLTAWVLVFECPRHEGAIDVLWRFFMPAAALVRYARNEHPLAGWTRAGLIRKTDGNMISKADIMQVVNADREMFQVVEAGYDPYEATAITSELSDAGLAVARVPQTINILNEPSKELDRLVSEGRFHHNGNPVARWMATNLVWRRDVDNHIKPDKGRSDKIDGISAAVTALERLIRSDEEPSVYEQRGLTSFA